MYKFNIDEADKLRTLLNKVEEMAVTQNQEELIEDVVEAANELEGIRVFLNENLGEVK